MDSQLNLSLNRIYSFTAGMSWIWLSLLSAFLLGLYDLAKKTSLRENAVLPVLFFATVSGGIVWLPFILWSTWLAEGTAFPLYVEAISGSEHCLVLAKSALVGASWIFGYFALKKLPLSIAAPIRATSPLWTILFAVCFLNESPNSLQWLGIVLVLTAFFIFSLVGKFDGIQMHRDKWIGCMILATLLGAASSLYDKYLLQTIALPVVAVQAWFSVYLVAVLLPFYGCWLAGAWPRGKFYWKWTIPLIGWLLLLADFAYFTALSQPDALISVIAPLRRGAVVVAFLGGIFLYGEKHFRAKALCIAVLLTGVFLIQQFS
ncbi:MAG: EamA family transporter [Coraliomargaritaceae bacterium]